LIPVVVVKEHLIDKKKKWGEVPILTDMPFKVPQLADMTGNLDSEPMEELCRRV